MGSSHVVAPVRKHSDRRFCIVFTGGSGYSSGMKHIATVALMLNLGAAGIRASRSDFLEPILMMESAENGGASNRISPRNTMPMSAFLRERT
jgi:hypothetical protein